MTTFLRSHTANDSFADAVTAMLLLVKGQLKEGGDYWAYIAIKPEMLASFSAAKAKGMFDLEAYGTILEWGKGDQPPAQTHAQMQAIYGVSRSEEADLRKQLKHLEFS